MSLETDLAAAHERLDVLLRAVHHLLSKGNAMSKQHDDILANIAALDTSATALITAKAQAEESYADVAAAITATKAKIDAALAPAANAAVMAGPGGGGGGAGPVAQAPVSIVIPSAPAAPAPVAAAA